MVDSNVAMPAARGASYSDSHALLYCPCLLPDGPLPPANIALAGMQDAAASAFVGALCFLVAALIVLPRRSAGPSAHPHATSW